MRVMGRSWQGFFLIGAADGVAGSQSLTAWLAMAPSPYDLNL
jgi:hypothetical protein